MADLVGFIGRELQKLNILQQDGIISMESFQAKAQHLQEHGRLPEAGVGMTIRERHPFSIEDLRPDGPAAKTAVIKIGDELTRVDGFSLHANLTGEQVRTLVIGPVGSVVELQFREVPRRTERGAYRVRLVRQAAELGGTMQMSRGDAMAPPPGMPPPPASPAGARVYEDDFDKDIKNAEQATKHQYDARRKKWARTTVTVCIDKKPFAEGAMRQAYHMKDMSVAAGPAGHDNRYVLKLSKDPNEVTQTYFDDVEMQMEAKMYAEMYNGKKPPKTIDFLDAYVLVLHRPGERERICAVEKFIEGEYVKFNNNWDWADDKRNTPQAFSHFTYEESQRQILVCDIQGVGDTWTDPQIHSWNQEGYGKGNMGQEGMDKFLKTHKCNDICRYLQLPSTGRFKPQAPGATVVPATRPSARAEQPPQPPPRVPNAEIAAARQQELRVNEELSKEIEAKAEQLRKEQEAKAEVERQNARLQEELDRMKAEFERRHNAPSQTTSQDAPAEDNVSKLCAMGFDRSLAARALQVNTSIEEAADWCLSSATAANLDAGPAAGARGGGNDAAAGPPQRPLPAQPPTTQMSRANPDHRLAKEWENQQRNNTAQNAMVFAQPRFPDSAQGLREWVGVILGPEGSVYEGGAFQVSMSFGDEYPLKPPVVKFVTKVFHPNVWGEPDERQGEICLDILKENWSPAMRVQAVLLSIVELLREPNGNSALWPLAGQMYQKDRAMFDRCAREWVQTHAFKAQDISNAHNMGYPTTKIVAALRQENLDFDKALNLLLDENWRPKDEDVCPRTGGGGGGSGGAGANGAQGEGAGINASELNRNVRLHQQQAVQQGIQQQMQQNLQRAQHERSTAPPSYDQASTLPEGWKEYKDTNTGRPYYHHIATNTTKWERPVAYNV